MHLQPSSLTAIALLALGHGASAAPSVACGVKPVKRVELGPRPYWLIQDMADGPLKKKLASCADMDFKPSRWSIGHRGGGPLMFPEESVASELAGARMGAGILECDVVFTKDRKLVCRHDQCDLHTTTNIVATPLNSKCTQPFQPASGVKPASAKCCTSDITAAEFKSLCAKMDGFNASATTPADYLKGTPPYRTDLYANECAVLMTHADYIALVKALGLSYTPELKMPQVPMPFQGNYTQEMYAQQFVDEYRAAGIPFDLVWPQSFQYDDILFWMKNEPEFAERAVFLDESGDTPETFAQAVANLTEYAAAGVKIMAPPLYYLVAVENGKIVPSEYAIKAKQLGMKLISWSLERSGWLSDGSHGGYYYTSIANVTTRDGDVFNLVHALAQDVGIIGLFSDWSATVTYYANCFGIFP